VYIAPQPVTYVMPLHNEKQNFPSLPKPKHFKQDHCPPKVERTSGLSRRQQGDFLRTLAWSDKELFLWMTVGQSWKMDSKKIADIMQISVEALWKRMERIRKQATAYAASFPTNN
jgi:hypothetical protein